MSSKNNNSINIPEARAAMDKFKMEAASDVVVYLHQKQHKTTHPKIKQSIAIEELRSLLRKLAV